MVFKRRSQVQATHGHSGCGKHPLERATNRCSDCGRSCCDRCSFEVRRYVLCIDCGLVRGGIVTRRAG